MNHDNEAVNAFQQYFRPGLHLSSHLDTWMVAWSMQQQKIDDVSKELALLKGKLFDEKDGIKYCDAFVAFQINIEDLIEKIDRLEALLREARESMAPFYSNWKIIIDKIDAELGGNK